MQHPQPVGYFLAVHSVTLVTNLGFEHGYRGPDSMYGQQPWRYVMLASSHQEPSIWAWVVERRAVRAIVGKMSLNMVL